jgi:hypothetical protein
LTGDENALSRALVSGDERAFDVLMERESTRVFRACYRVLGRIDELKLPALVEAGVTVAKPIIVLISRAGFGDSLREAAVQDGGIRLVGIDELSRSTAGR